jgi:hypothetical protein
LWVQYISKCMLAVNSRSEIFSNIDLRFLGRVVLTLFSSGNIMVLLSAVTLYRLHQLRKGCLSDFHCSNILLTTFIYHFEMNLSECADNGLSKIWGNVQKSVWKDWQKTRNTQSGCMKCGRYSQCTHQEQKIGRLLLEKKCLQGEILLAFNTGNVIEACVEAIWATAVGWSPL